MPKYIELRRHSIKQGFGDRMLSDAGIAFARQVGETSLRGLGFTHLFNSTLPRTQQTLRAFREGAGDFPSDAPGIFSPHVEVAIRPEAIELWKNGCGPAEQVGKDMMLAALEYDQVLCERIGRDGVASLKTWLAGLPDGSRALVVDHSPFLEFLPYALFGTILPQLQYCQGFRLVEEDGVLRLDGECRETR